MDFLAQLMSGHLTEWIKQRDWKATDLLCKLVKKRTIDSQLICVWITAKKRFGKGISTPKRKSSIVLQKRWTVDGQPELRVTESKYALAGSSSLIPIPFTYQGSILSQLKDSVLSPDLLQIKRALQSIKSLELLSPHLMRQRARQADDVGVGGEKLLSVPRQSVGIRKTNHHQKNE